MQQRIELSIEEIESLKELIQGISQELDATEKKIEKLKESLNFLNVVLQNILQDK
jgi:phage shock protein A